MENELKGKSLIEKLRLRDSSRTPITAYRRYSGRNLFHGGYVSSVYDWQGTLLEKHYEISKENGESRLANIVNLRRD